MHWRAHNITILLPSRAKSGGQGGELTNGKFWQLSDAGDSASCFGTNIPFSHPLDTILIVRQTVSLASVHICTSYHI